jgi:hypothetical protein
MKGHGGRRKAKSHVELQYIRELYPKKESFLSSSIVHILNYFENTMLTKIEEIFLEISFTITETVNEENSIWRNYFLKSFDSRVGRLVEYSFVFSQHSGCVRMYFIL